MNFPTHTAGRVQVFALVLLGGAVVAGYWLLDAPGGLVAWTIALLLLGLTARLPSRAIGSPRRFTRIVILSYLLISLAGLVEVGDNLRNYDIPFGKQADDSRYYEQTINLLQHGPSMGNHGLFEIALAGWGFIPSYVLGLRLGLLDFLPVNWAFGALVVGLVGRLCEVATHRRLPVWLLAAALIGNFKFLDTVTHLYRDAFLFVFFLAGLIAVLRGRPWLGLLCALPVATLRGASFLLLLLFMGLHLLRGWLGTSLRFYAAAVGLAAVLLVVVPACGNRLLTYASGFGSQSAIGLATWSFEQNMEFRTQTIASQVAAGSTMEAALSKGGVVSYLSRPIVYLFFPLRFWPLRFEAKSMSGFTQRSVAANGLFLFHALSWVTIVCWIVVLPLLSLGSVAAARGAATANVFVVYFFACLLAVAFVSLQMRHGVAFVVITPVLVAWGLSFVQSNLIARRCAYVAGVGVTGLILLYNLLSGSVL